MSAFVFVIALSTTYLFAGFVKGAMGLGLPTIAMGLLSLAMPPSDAAAILVVPTLVTNIWQMFAGPALGRLLKRFAVMLIAAVLGTFATIRLLTEGSPLALVAIGLVLTLYGAIGLASTHIALPQRHERWLSPLIGFVSGMLGGATGVFFIPSIPYLGSVSLEKEELVQVVGIWAFTTALSIGVALAVHGRFHAGVAASSLFAVFPAVVGMYIGQHIRRRMDVLIFRRWFLISLALLGVYMVAHSLWAVFT